MFNKNNLDSKTEQRFWSKVNYPGNETSCWEWTGYCNKRGYGKFGIDGTSVPAHRISYEYYNGPITNNLIIRHKCDNPKCCNPNHLEIGTQFDNIRDMHDRGRALKPTGSQHGMSILDETILEEIINGILSGIFLSIKDITDNYDMSRNSIVQILNGKRWKIVTDKISIQQLQLIRSLIIHDKYKFTEDEVRDIRNRIKNNESNASIGGFYGVNIRSINDIKTGRSYLWVK